jgi:glycerophosphoryl diester phosphodiesterase
MVVKYNSSAYVQLNKPKIFAHRGASAYAPENTMAAFSLAVHQGADAIELDAKLSADGYVVVMHDDTVDRTTNGTGRVSSLSLAELQKLDAGSKFPPLFKSEKVPTLEEVYETLGRKILINVELTNYSTPMDDLPDKVIALVKKFNLEERVLLSSFSLISLIQVRKILDKVPLGLLSFSGLGEIVVRSRLVRFGPLLALHSSFKDVTPSIIQAIHNAKSHLHAYTVNEPEQIMKLCQAGVDGIFSDDPLMARRIVFDNKH